MPMRMRRTSLVLVLIGLLAEVHLVGAVGYENDFEKSQVGSTPDDFLILDGSFAVQEAAENKFLELPGAPLDSYGLLFGPTDSTGQMASVRILGISKGRRSPTFGLGLNGVPGFKLQVSPAKKQVELLRGDAAVLSAPFNWISGKWTWFRVQLRKASDGTHLMEGKVWMEGQEEPKEWLVSFPVKDLPPSGRASIIGSPYAGTPIQFDDLKVSKLGN